jgi:hypothetical protein
MAGELDGVHAVALEAAKIWGDSGRAAAAAITEVRAGLCPRHSWQCSAAAAHPCPERVWPRFL